MGKILFDEPPMLLVPSLAEALGAKEALLLQQMHYWVERSTNVKDGRKWIYNTYEDWHKQFTFYSVATIRRTITHLEKMEILVTANYNKAGFDKTKWYSIDYEKLEKSVSRRSAQNEQTMSSNCADGAAQNEQTNTIDYTETTTETNKESAATAQLPAVPAENDPRPPAGEAIEYFETTWSKFPNPQQVQDLTEDVDEYGKDLTIAALKLAARNEVKSSGLIRYVEKVLRDWRAAKITTVEEAREEMRRHLIQGRGSYGPKQSMSREELPDYNQQEVTSQPDSAGETIEQLRARIDAAKNQHAEEEQS
ncbi:DnaD domain-containing protein [Furfurilactobacillus sp. WILCCON 0119]